MRAALPRTSRRWTSRRSGSARRTVRPWRLVAARGPGTHITRARSGGEPTLLYGPPAPCGQRPCYYAVVARRGRSEEFPFRTADTGVFRPANRVDERIALPISMAFLPARLHAAG